MSHQNRESPGNGTPALGNRTSVDSHIAAAAERVKEEYRSAGRWRTPASTINSEVTDGLPADVHADRTAPCILHTSVDSATRGEANGMSDTAADTTLMCRNPPRKDVNRLKKLPAAATIHEQIVEPLDACRSRGDS